MTLDARSLGIAIALGAAFAPSIAGAYPVRPVTILVGFPPGGSTDILARILAEKMTERLGQSVVVENRPGATGTIAANLVAKAPPDGHLLLMGAAGHTTTPSLFKLPYDGVRDFTPVTNVAAVTIMLVVHPSVPAKSVRELITVAKSKPGILNYASGGNGSMQHLAGELFKQMVGVDMAHIPYKGSGAAVIDLVSGRVSLMFDQVPSSLPHVRTGKLRALAVTSTQRSATVPELPTLAEAGLPGYSVMSWTGIIAPANTPPAVVNRLHTEIVSILKLPDVKSRFASIGAEPIGNTPEQFQEFVRTETARWAALIKAAGVQVE